MLPSSITTIILAAVLFVGFLPSLATAQLQQQQEQQQQTTTTTTTTPPSSSLSITTTPPLTPEEQEQQNRLQNTIAATTANLNETEKQVSEVVFTPRWSEPLWVNANSIAVLVAYCLPGEFADSGQEILGGFELEVLESYAIDLPQGFMAWMAIVGNEDQQNRRFPAAVGVICASDANDAASRILTPGEQQQINNIIQRFTTIQNTQVTNIENVINIINNVTSTPPQNATGGGGMTTPPPPPPGNDTGGNDTGTTTPPPPGNDTGVGGTEQPLGAEIIPNATIVRPCNIRTTCVEAYTGATIKFDTIITGGSPPYGYYWMTVPDQETIDQGHKSITLSFFEPGIFTYVFVVNDRHGNVQSDRVQVTIQERSGVSLPPETGQEGEQPGGGLLPRPRTLPQPPPNDNEVISPPPEGESAPPPTNDTGTTITTPATNDTGAASASATEPPLMAEAITNATQAVAPATIRLDANITGGAPPYSYSWSVPNVGLIDYDRSITQMFFEPGTFTYTLTVTDSRGKTVTDNVQIVISERLPTEGIVAPEPGGVAPPIEGLSPRVPGGEGEEQGGGVVTEEPEGVPPPPPTGPGEEGGEGDTGEGEEGGGGEPQGGVVTEEPTGGGGEEPPPDEEPAIPPG
jgi:hypothetical protein